MTKTNLCFLLKDDHVLLGMKKRGFGVGKWNGFGGKVKDGEDARTAVVREVYEEAGITIDPSMLHDAGTITFTFKDNSEWDNECKIFTTKEWSGDPRESEEMRPEWYPIANPPFDLMWVDDSHWLPLVLQGKKINAKFLFDDKGGEILNFAISQIPDA